MPRKPPRCKKCKQPLKGHLDKKICPSEHGHIETADGRYTCSNKGCAITFINPRIAHNHSLSSSCKHFQGEEIVTPCPNNCGRMFTGSSARSNALTHSKTMACPLHPDRVDHPTYKTTVIHTVDMNKKHCSSCKIRLPIDQFSSIENKHNDTGLAYMCYGCCAIRAMHQSTKCRARKEGNSDKEITYEFIKSLVTSHCPVFDSLLQYGGSNQGDNSATIDAIVHKKGHITGNLKIISKKANTIKNNSTLEEMKMLLDALKTWEEPIVDHIVELGVKKASKLTKEQTTKCCSLCREEKPLDMYRKDKTATTLGISSKCIKCSALSSMIKNAKIRCKDREYSVEIDCNYLYRLTKNLKHCPVLGTELLYGGTESIKDNSASIDRFDTTKGYVRGNVWIISCKANRMKSDATIDEIEKVYKYMKTYSEQDEPV